MICFAWTGFPQYAARCIHEFVKVTEEAVVVVATKPTVPVRGMEEICGCRVVWIEMDETRKLSEVIGSVPRCIFVGGWAFKVFNRFRDEVKEAGGVAICMSDNNYRFSFKELLKSVRFRLLLRNKYDGFFVPGRSGQKLLRFYGVPASSIATNMYSADSALFKNGLPLEKRDKKIIYVGQFVHRKNVLRLVEAFAQAARASDGDWELDLYGSGVLKDSLVCRVKELNEQINYTHCRIGIYDFVQPEQLASLYQRARIFCLPSIEEHWGLVIHEAALSGCVLLLSKSVGAVEDFLTKGNSNKEFINGFVFNPRSVQDMAITIGNAMRLRREELRAANAASLDAAQNISVQNFANQVGRFSGQT